MARGSGNQDERRGAVKSRAAAAPIETTKRIPVRLTDVATRARCSAATVSRVLNRPGSVNPEVRLRVEAAVRDLGYMRNGAARALRSRRSNMIGLVLPTLKQGFFTPFVEALQETLMRENHLLIVTSSEYSMERELLQARLLAERGIDGLVLIGHTRRPDVFALMQAQDLPYVLTHTFRPRLRHPVVGFDNGAAMKVVADFLVDLGHREFAVMAGSQPDCGRVAERVDGAVAALAARGIDLAPDRIIRGETTIEGGRAAMRCLLQADPRPTAIMCVSDVLAYGVLIEARARGLVVPAQLSVTGFDDLAGSAHLDPGLTSLSISSDEMGRLAGDYLLARILGKPHADRTPVATTLMVRGTTAPPAA